MTPAACDRAYGRTALLIVVLAAVLRCWGLANGLPHPLTRPDEEVLLNHLAPLARGDFDLQYAVYPSLYFYVNWVWTACGLWLAGALGFAPRETFAATLASHPERVLLASRALSAAASTLTVAALMRFTRTAMGRAAALLAGALLATNLLHVRDAHAAKPDALLTLGVTTALALMAGYLAAPAPRRAATIGIAIGLTTGIKYPGLLLLAPAWLTMVCASPRAGVRRLLDPNVAIVGATAAVVFVATSPYLFVNPQTGRAVLGVFGSIFPSLFPGLVPATLPPALLEMTPARHWWSGFAYHATVSLRYGVGWLPTFLAVPALAWGCMSRRPVAWIAVAWVVIYFAVHGLSPMLLSRYMTPILPALFLLESGMLAVAVDRCASWSVPAAVAAGVALLVPSLMHSAAYDRVLGHTDTRVLATEWLAAHTQPGTRVLVVGTVLWGYGEPLMPPGVEKLRLDPDAVALPPGVSYVIGHGHPTFASRFDPSQLGPLADRLQLVLDLNPFKGAEDAAVFETLDAYYVPLAGFSAVERTGPHIRIYAVTG